jgi:hypothetical protein
MNAPSNPSDHGFTDRPTLDLNALTNLALRAVPTATENTLNPQAGWHPATTVFAPPSQPPSGNRN